MKTIVYAALLLSAAFVLAACASDGMQAGDIEKEIGPDIPVMKAYASKIVYTTDMEADTGALREDCSRLGGEFNECGDVCPPGAELCAEVCAYTCELGGDLDEAAINRAGMQGAVNEPRVDQYRPGMELVSPTTIVGTAPGSWFFEGRFMVRLQNDQGELLTEAPAKAIGDWMRKEAVPFEAHLVFDKPQTSSGRLILEKANPSGISDKAESKILEVSFPQSR